MDTRPRCPQCDDVLIEGECITHGVVTRPATPAEPAAEEFEAPPGQRARMVTPEGGGTPYVVFEPESVARKRDAEDAARAETKRLADQAGMGAALDPPSPPSARGKGAKPGEDETVVLDQRGLLIAGALAAVLLVASLFGLWRGQSGLNGRIDELNASIAAIGDRLDEVDRFQTRASNRLKTVEARLGSEFNAQRLSKKVLKSVLTVRVGSGANAVIGSGFVAQAGKRSSTIITNFHVVAGVGEGGRVTVRQKGLSGITGRVTIADPARDLAAIRINRSLPALDVDHRFPERGTSVLAVGSPLGLGGSVSEGTVSGKFQGLIQFTAPVSPGSSGGPLVDGTGRVVGVVTIKIVGFGAEGIAFAVPSSDLCSQVLNC